MNKYILNTFLDLFWVNLSFTSRRSTCFDSSFSSDFIRGIPESKLAVLCIRLYLIWDLMAYNVSWKQLADRETDRQTDTQTGRQTDTQAHRHTHTKTTIHTGTQAHRQTDRHGHIRHTCMRLYPHKQTSANTNIR